MSEDMAMHIISRVIAGLKDLHGSRSHRKLCGAHVYACRHEMDDDFKFGYGSTVVDLNEDLEFQKSSDWRYLPVTDVWRWARASKLVGEPDDVASHSGDVWIIGILGLELIYSGLRFTSGDEFRQRMRELRDREKLPNDLVHDHDSPSLFGMFIPIGSLSGSTNYPGHQPKVRTIGKYFSGFVKRCLRENPHERPTIEELNNDPYVHSVQGSVYAQPSFKAGMSEDMAMHIISMVIAGLKDLHGSRSHRKLCGAHVYACHHEMGDDFKFGYGSTVVDLNEDLEFQKSPDWRYLPVTDVWRWARASELVGEPDDVASHPGDVWMIGILGLELIYSSLKFTSGDEFRQRMRELMDREKLPNDMVHDHDSPSLFGMFIPIGSSSGSTNYPGQQTKVRTNGKRFSGFVKRCLRENPHERPTIEELNNDPYVHSVQGNNLGTRFLF